MDEQRFEDEHSFKLVSNNTWLQLLSLLLLMLLTLATPMAAVGEKKADVDSGRRMLLQTDDTKNLHDDDLIWISTGGGWRSLVSSIGFASLFAQMGLFKETKTDDDGGNAVGTSQFSDIVASSGTAWFSTAFFFSPTFYDRLIESGTSSGDSSSNEIFDFVLSILNAYLSLISAKSNSSVGADSSVEGQEEEEDKCSIPGSFLARQPIPELKPFQLVCDFLSLYNLDWAEYNLYVLDSIGLAVGDPSFTNRSASSTNTILPATNMMIQIALANSRDYQQSSESTTRTLLSLLGNNQDEVYTTNLDLMYVVNGTTHDFLVANGDDGELVSYNYNTTDADALLSQLGDIYIPSFNSTGTITMPTPSPLQQDESTVTTTNWQKPWNNEPTVNQVSAAATAALGFLAGVTPITDRQAIENAVDRLRNEFNSTEELVSEFEQVVTDQMFPSGDFAKLAICSRWPETCSDDEESSSDSILLDAAFSDYGCLAQTVGLYQRRNRNTGGGRLRIIYTQNKETLAEGTEEEFTRYFSTNTNDHVKQAQPGEFSWRVGTEESMDFSIFPAPSRRIFSNQLTADDIRAMREKIAGSTMTTFTLSAETIDNPVYGVTGGQSIDLFVVELNVSILPSDLFGELFVTFLREGYAAMAQEIADSVVLKERLQSFLEEAVEESPLPSLTPSASPPFDTSAPITISAPSPRIEDKVDSLPSAVTGGIIIKSYVTAVIILVNVFTLVAFK